jgi:hypothetical protein
LGGKTGAESLKEEVLIEDVLEDKPVEEEQPENPEELEGEFVPEDKVEDLMTEESDGRSRSSYVSKLEKSIENEREKRALLAK